MSGKPREITWIVDSNGCHVCTSHIPGTYGYPLLERAGRRIGVPRLSGPDGAALRIQNEITINNHP